MTNTWSQTVIFPAITTNLSHHRTGVVIKHIILITVNSQCDRHELGPYPRARLSIYLIYTLQRLVHCTHTTEPMASHSHSGGPTAFRQNRSTAMTLSRPLRPTPLWAKSWVAPCLPKAPTATVVEKRPPSWQKRSQTGTRIHNNNNGDTRLMSAYLIRVARAHNLPSLEAPARGTTIDPVRTFP